MKREVILAFILLSFIVSISLIYATEETQVEKAYAWLDNQTKTAKNCTDLTFEPRVFSLLANGNCENETWQDNQTTSTTICWPYENCKVKLTALAILALNENFDTAKGESWLLEQTTDAPSNIEWFLEIESSKATTCLINYSSDSAPYRYQIKIAEDKKISANRMEYMSLAQGNYWLKIYPSIYNNPINITCNESFITTLLFKKESSSTYHVSGIVHYSSSPNGKTSEQVNSVCFTEGKKSSASSCNYEASLWATFVLRSLDYDVSKYMPYLITMMEEPENERYLPEAFLYYITGEFRTELLTKQKSGYYWEESGNEFYDTALALLPLYNDGADEKANAKFYLLDKQHDTGIYAGSWNSGNVRDTAFILYSLWPQSPPDIYTECVIDSDCPQYDCQTRSCEYGWCQYYPYECSGNTEDGCCPDECITATDSDCTSGENECAHDSDCDDYSLPDGDAYCQGETEVWLNDSEWDCVNNICTVVETPEKFETCDAGEECYAGSCLNNETIPEDECISDYGCSYPEFCISGYCTVPDCEEAGYYCMSSVNCQDNGGSTLDDYSCSGEIYSCCDTAPFIGKCEDDNNGVICSYDEYCFDGTTVDASDIAYDETCCVGGTCEKEIVSYACEDNQGTCRSSCESDEKETTDYTCDFDESCCISKGKKTSYAWVWVLLVLILISAIGIVFRDKLRVQLLKLKTMFGKKKEKRPFEMPMTTHPLPAGRILPRPSHQPSQQTSPPVRKPFSPIQRQPMKKPEDKSKGELDEVLKKLKEMGK